VRCFVTIELACILGVCSYQEGIYVMICGAFGTITVMIFSYYKIFHILRRHYNEIQAQLPSSQIQHGGINLTLFKKTLSNIVCIMLWFILSYFPCLYILARTYIQRNSTPLNVAIRMISNADDDDDDNTDNYYNNNVDDDTIMMMVIII